jgi:hypothetical protein
MHFSILPYSRFVFEKHRTYIYLSPLRNSLFENGVLRITFGPKREKVAEERNLQSKERHNLY